jgi:hypothetical protein
MAKGTKAATRKMREASTTPFAQTQVLLATIHQVMVAMPKMKTKMKIARSLRRLPTGVMVEAKLRDEASGVL